MFEPRSPSFGQLRVSTVATWAGCLLLAAILFAVPRAPAADQDVHALVEIIEENARGAFGQKDREAAIEKLAHLATVEAAEALLPLFDDPFEHIRDRALSAWIAMLRENRTGDLHTWFSGRVVKHRSPRVRVAAAKSLALSSGAELAGDVRMGLKGEKETEVIVAWCRAGLALRGSPDLAGAYTPLLQHKDGAVVFEACHGVAKFDGEAGVKELQHTFTRTRTGLGRAGAWLALVEGGQAGPGHIEAILADKAEEPRIALLETLAARRAPIEWPEPGRTLLRRLLEDDSPRVRTAAVQAALHIWDAGVVVPLIDRMEFESGRVRDDIHRALITLSGIDVGPDASLWKSWWSARGTVFQSGPKPEPDLYGRIRFREAEERRGPLEGTATRSFYDVPLSSGRFVFVFDLSGSMADPARADDDRSKFDLLVERFRAVLDDLPATTQFDIWVYRYPSRFPPEPKMERALGKLSPADAATKKKAVKWMEGQKVGGWGAFYEPLELAIAEGADTVVLLSDGVPSRGRFDRGNRLLEELARANRFGWLHVDTILVGKSKTDRRFMDELAGSTGGRSSAAAGDAPK